MTRFVSSCPEQTEALGRDFVRTLKSGTVVCLNGEMGAGKTVFVRGCLRGLGYDGPVTSPTFALCNVYQCGDKTVSHYDLYRINGEDELFSVGFFDDPSDLIFVEWSRNCEGMPDDAVELDFSYGQSPSERIIFGIAES